MGAAFSDDLRAQRHTFIADKDATRSTDQGESLLLRFITERAMRQVTLSVTLLRHGGNPLRFRYRTLMQCSTTLTATVVPAGAESRPPGRCGQPRLGSRIP